MASAYYFKYGTSNTDIKDLIQNSITSEALKHTGPTGVTGPQGDKGSDYPSTSIGSQGPTGLKGPPGISYTITLTGDTGPKGTQGPSGIGPQGNTGFRGPKGNDSASTGNTGYTGPKGPKGPTGSAGDQGDTGPNGDQGPQGPQGYLDNISVKWNTNIGSIKVNQEFSVSSTIYTTLSGDNIRTYYNNNNSPQVFFVAINASSGRGLFSSILLFSDKRIKKDFIPIRNESGIDIIRKIQPMNFKMISGNNSLLTGFIAQEVEQVLPYAVNNNSDFIPNIFQHGIFTKLENNKYIVYLNKPIIENIDLDCKVKLKLEINKNSYSNFFLLEIKEKQNLIIEGIINESDNITNEVFIYGTYVTDFKVLNKINIFTNSIAAVKYLNDEIKYLENEIMEQQKMIDNILFH